MLPVQLKTVVRIFVEVVEVHARRLQEVLADGLRKLPTPLRVEMGIWHDVKGRLMRGRVSGRSGLVR